MGRRLHHDSRAIYFKQCVNFKGFNQAFPVFELILLSILLFYIIILRGSVKSHVASQPT